MRAWNDREGGLRRVLAGIAALLLVWACSGGQDAEGQRGHAPPSSAAAAPPPGITIDRVRATVAPSGGARRHPITIARFDLAHYQPVLLTARDDGGSRTLERWVREEHLVAAINAAMYEPDGRASGLCVRRGVEESPDDPRFGGIYALDPVAAGSAAFAMFGRECPGFDLAGARASWGTLVASYRLLDCDGHPIAWVDPDRYSAAAVGVDREGRLVMVHSRTPYRMRELAEMLASPELGLTQMIFVEGGPEATLIVEAGSTRVREVGLRRDLPGGIEPERDVLYSLPNVLGVRAIGP